MTIGNLEVIDIGLANESTGSDSLYLAFNKTKNNFAVLANTASQYVNFTGNTGIGVNANATTGTVYITNTGVNSLTAGDSSIILTEPTPGNISIVASGVGNGGSGTVTSVGVTSSTLTISNSPIVSSGNITLNLTSISPTLAGTYTYPTVTVDQFGRVTTIANAVSVGTVTSVGIAPGAGISVTNSPITASGDITVINTGVTRVSAGSGIQVSSGNGNVTISTTAVAAVTSVSLASSSLTVTGSPITGSGTITVELPSAITIAGNLTAGNILSNGKMILNGSEDLAASAAANLLVTASYFTTAAAETATLAAGTNGQIKTFMMLADGGDMVITVTNAGWHSSGTGTITFNDIGDGCTLQYIANKWFCVGNNGVTFA
jgi:hypothetical protein